MLGPFLDFLSRRFLANGWALSAVFCLIAGTAGAQGEDHSGQRVLVVNAAPDDVRAEETLWRVRELLGEMKGLENIDLVSLLDGDDPRGIEAALDALENGGRAFDEFDFSSLNNRSRGH